MNIRIWGMQSFVPFWRWQRRILPFTCLFRFLATSHVHWFMVPSFHLQSQQSYISFSDFLILSPNFKNPYDYFGPTRIIQDNISILLSVDFPSATLIPLVIIQHILRFQWLKPRNLWELVIWPTRTSNKPSKNDIKKTIQFTISF